MLRRRSSPDPLARAAVLGVAAGRAGIGAAVLLATRPALRGLGFSPADTGARTLARLAGSRDLAIAAGTFAVRDDPAALRSAALGAAAVDAADTVCFAVAGRDPAAGRAAVQGVLAAAAATAVGVWAAGRLGR